MDKKDLSEKIEHLKELVEVELSKNGRQKANRPFAPSDQITGYIRSLESQIMELQIKLNSLP